MKIIIIFGMCILILLTGCNQVEEIQQLIEEKHIVWRDNHNFITFADDVFKEGGEYKYKYCYEWSNNTECKNIECTFAGYVRERCVKNGTDGMNTHTYEESRLFDDCCKSICRKLDYDTSNTISEEFDSECLCWIPNSPLRISMYMDINKYNNYTNECNEYVEAQYGKYWVNRK